MENKRNIYLILIFLVIITYGVYHYLAFYSCDVDYFLEGDNCSSEGVYSSERYPPIIHETILK